MKIHQHKIGDRFFLSGFGNVELVKVYKSKLGLRAFVRKQKDLSPHVYAVSAHAETGMLLTLTQPQLNALILLGTESRCSYGTPFRISTFQALVDRGFAHKTLGPSAFWCPTTGIRFRISKCGEAYLKERGL